MPTRKTTKKASPKKRRSDSNPAPTQTERLIRLEEGLKAVEQNQTNQLQQVDQTLQGIRNDIRALYTRVEEQQYGRDGKPGAIIKLDRLEQSMAQAKLVVRLMGGALATLVVGAAWAALSGIGS